MERLKGISNRRRIERRVTNSHEASEMVGGVGSPSETGRNKQLSCRNIVRYQFGLAQKAVRIGETQIALLRNHSGVAWALLPEAVTKTQDFLVLGATQTYLPAPHISPITE